MIWGRIWRTGSAKIPRLKSELNLRDRKASVVVVWRWRMEGVEIEK